MSRVDFTATDNKTMTLPGTGYRSVADFFKAHRIARIGILSNPLSGGNRKGLKKIRTAAANAGPDVLQREAQTPSEVAETLADFARREVNTLVINGGDGTVQAVLTAIFRINPFETMPLLAVLRSAGTTSMIAGDIGLKGSRIIALQKLFRWTHANDSRATVMHRPVLKVQIPSEKEPVYGMFFGAAAIYQATLFCNLKIYTKGLRGELGAGMAMARFLLAVFLKDRKVVSAVPITMGVNQSPPQHAKYLLIFITTLQRLFLGLRPFWGSESKPLHYTSIGSNPRHFLRVLPFLMRGGRSPLVSPANGYISHNIDEARLTLNSGFNLDGELYKPDRTQGPVVVTHGGQVSFLQI